ncbi:MULTISPECIES: hypothetical protein [Enterococcus]|uniref:hypothetical protein n=1 Tax=Enterococcus TaxID=1350 RepID=UPI003970E82B
MQLNNRLELTERDLMILEVVNRWRIAQPKHFCSLLGFPSIEYVRKRIRKLELNGYLKRDLRQGREAQIYSLGTKGKEVLEISGLGKVSDATVRHELGVLTCTCFLREYFPEAKLDYHSIITDRDFRTYEYKKNNYGGYKKMTRKGDLTFKVGNDWWIVEYEKEKKEAFRVQTNVSANKNRAYGQIWIYPKMKSLIYNRLVEAKEYVGIDDAQFKLLTFEEVEKVLERPSKRLATLSTTPIDALIEEFYSYSEHREMDLFHTNY